MEIYKQAAAGGWVEEACLINNVNDPSRLTTAVMREKEGKEMI